MNNPPKSLEEVTFELWNGDGNLIDSWKASVNVYRNPEGKEFINHMSGIRLVVRRMREPIVRLYGDEKRKQ
jgi:hypothetical protein